MVTGPGVGAGVKAHSWGRNVGASTQTRRREPVDRTVFDAYSARGSTRALAAALDLACERAGAGRG